MNTEFDWIAVSISSSGTGKPFGRDGCIGARVMVGVRMADAVHELEVPVLLDAAEGLTVSEARNAALQAAVSVLRNVVTDLEGQTYEQLADRQNRQDDERDQKLQAELAAKIRGDSPE